MIYFIGGAPRTGKSQLAKRLSKVTGFSWLSTDNLRESTEFLEVIPRNNPLLSNWINWRESSYIEKTFSIPVKKIIENQNKESLEVVKLVKGLVHSLDYNKRDFILEGVALLPEFFDDDFINKYGIKFICVGNTDFDSFRKYSWENRVEGDWLDGVDEILFNNVISYSVKFSEVFRVESEKRSFKYFEVKSETFNNDLDLVTNLISSGEV